MEYFRGLIAAVMMAALFTACGGGGGSSGLSEDNTSTDENSSVETDDNTTVPDDENTSFDPMSLGGMTFYIPANPGVYKMVFNADMTHAELIDGSTVIESQDVEVNGSALVFYHDPQHTSGVTMLFEVESGEMYAGHQYYFDGTLRSMFYFFKEESAALGIQGTAPNEVLEYITATSEILDGNVLYTMDVQRYTQNNIDVTEYQYMKVSFYATGADIKSIKVINGVQQPTELSTTAFDLIDGRIDIPSGPELTLLYSDDEHWLFQYYEDTNNDGTRESIDFAIWYTSKPEGYPADL